MHCLQIYRKMQQRTILFDLHHNEYLNIKENDFKDFLKLLQNLNLEVKRNESNDLTKKVLQNIDILVLGNPIDDYFSNIEIKNIVDFVRLGGNLILVSEYGGDFLQKTNLNDVAQNFGVRFEKNLIKASNSNNHNLSSILHIHNFPNKNVSNGIRELVIGGTCSLFLSKNAKPLLLTSDKDTWSEIYNSSTEEWIKDKEDQYKISAYTEFGQGKVLALGDIDIFCSDDNTGIGAFDNQKFLRNIITWMIEPVKRPDVMTFILDQIGEVQNSVKEIHKTMNNIIETMSILEKRIKYIEDQFKDT